MILLPVAVPLLLLLLVLLLVVFVVLVELRVLSYAYRKIGIPARYVFLILVLTLVGSHVNIPLYSVPARQIVVPQTVGGSASRTRSRRWSSRARRSWRSTWAEP